MRDREYPGMGSSIITQNFNHQLYSLFGNSEWKDSKWLNSPYEVTLAHPDPSDDVHDNIMVNLLGPSIKLALIFLKPLACQWHYISTYSRQFKFPPEHILKQSSLPRQVKEKTVVSESRGVGTTFYSAAKRKVALNELHMPGYPLPLSLPIYSSHASANTDVL